MVLGVLVLGGDDGGRCGGDSGGGYSIAEGGKTRGGWRVNGEEANRVPVILGGEAPAGYRH